MPVDPAERAPGNAGGHSLDRALDRLEIRIGALCDDRHGRSSTPRAAALQAMNEDRARLALDLDETLARMRAREAELADLAEQASQSVAAAIEEVRAALGYGPQPVLPFGDEDPEEAASAPVDDVHPDQLTLFGLETPDTPVGTPPR